MAAKLANERAAARRHAGILSSAACEQIVLYLWQPEFAAAIDLVEHDASCYHIDDEYSFSDVELPNPEQETKLIRRVDQVIVHSIRLMEKKERSTPILLLCLTASTTKHSQALARSRQNLRACPGRGSVMWASSRSSST